MIIGIGSGLILMGILSLLIGDKEITTKGWSILRLFSWPHCSAKWAKWGIGIALIYAGIMVIFSGAK